MPALARAAPPARAPRDLASTLAYRNDDVLHKFRERFDVSWSEARELLAETCRWLWLTASCRAERQAGRARPPALAIDAPLVMLDEMWHTFVLFTRDYAAFCEQYLGGYVHHSPTRHGEKQRLRREWRLDPARARERERRRLAAQYACVYERLGEATLRKWYEDFPRRYPPDSVARLARAHARD